MEALGGGAVSYERGTPVTASPSSNAETLNHKPYTSLTVVQSHAKHILATTRKDVWDSIVFVFFSLLLSSLELSDEP